MGWRSGAAAAALAAALAVGSAAQAAPKSETFTLDQALSYPFVSHLVSADKADRIAWVRMVRGVRNVWVADGPAYEPRQVTQFTEDDGQELTNLAFSPDGQTLVFVRGGDHDANWPAAGDLAPDPTSSPVQPMVTIWMADPTGAKPAAEVVEGDAPVVSASHVMAYQKSGQAWTVGLDGKNPHRIFFDRGKDRDLAWSPDGTRLAFVSDRGDHSFVGVYEAEAKPIVWMAPSTGFDGDLAWSADGKKLAFTRQPGAAGAVDTMLSVIPQPWEIWSADAATGMAHRVWKGPETLHGSYPDVAGGANLHWASGGKLTFLSFYSDNWPHLYAVGEAGGEAKLLTPGPFMVEHIAASRDGSALIYSANTGTAKDDDDRRHIFRVGVDGGAPVALTRGETLQWAPVAVSDGTAFIAADARRPPSVAVETAAAREPKVLAHQEPPAGFAGERFVTPKQVSFKAPDGLVIHGQLFEAQGASSGGGAKKPAVVFVHGGPPRQMMLGWSYMGYYSNAYAMNQYLAAHGFNVLSVNYRLGIGYGWDFQHPEKGGPQGSSEYQDVLAGARYLQTLPEVDGAHVGIWGGSYGGLLTALALARNSDVFKAGVDLHGVHDWSRETYLWDDETGRPWARFEQGDRAKAAEVAFKASPDADVATWRSPVLLIQGDDDRNVKFHQTIDLARRLRAKGDVEVEELVFPDDIHDFLRWENWRKADTATAEFLTRKLGAQ